MTPPVLPNMRSARTVTLIEVVVLEGEGTQEAVAQEVTYFFTLEGKQVAQSSPVPMTYAEASER